MTPSYVANLHYNDYIQRNMPKRKYKPYHLTTNFYRKLRRSNNLNSETINTNVVTSNFIKKNATSVSANDCHVLNSMEPSNLEKPSTAPNYDCSVNNEEFVMIPEQDDFDQGKLSSDKVSLLYELTDWAISHKLTLASVTNLLTILRSHGMTDLPKDARTLLKTPSATDIIEMGAGKFWYNSIKLNLLSALSVYEVCLPMTISLLFNVDGMSPFKSSLHQFWPISFIIDNMRHLQPMVAGIFFGDGKPPLQLYFQQFVKELKELCKNGIEINEHKVDVRVKCFVCDTPARSFIKGTIHF